MVTRRTVRILLICAALAAGLPPTAGAEAQPAGPDPLVTASVAALDRLVSKETCGLRDAADGTTENGFSLPYVYCNDGLPPPGGGDAAVPVPVKYAATSGDDWSGLPKPAGAEEAAAADAQDDLRPEADDPRRISLDVDITLPASGAARKLLGATDLPVMRAPRNGWPVIVFMHGCCGGNKTSWEADTIDAAREKWHHSNAWFAARGYVVITYTARGFRNGDDRGSTGTTQLDSRRYEVNDLQYLVGLLADHDAQRRASGQAPLFRIDPKRIGVVGGSYGGGLSWLTLTDPTWKSPLSNVAMRLAAVVPKYGWTDLVEALVPSGHYLDLDPTDLSAVIAPTDPAAALSRRPLGVEKQSIVSGLYASGNLASGDHTTFPEYLHEVFARLQQGEPYDGDPLLEAAADTFLKDRSAYFQQRFWTRVAGGLRVPVFSAATWTDPLFPTMEHLRFYNKVRSVAPTYPITMYLGDYQHFAQNKAKEWGDLCGSDHHVCTLADHTRPDGSLALTAAPTRVRAGINSRINRFLDHHLRALGKTPPSNVSATTTVCPANATQTTPADEPGLEYRARTWRALAPTMVSFSFEGGGTTSSVTLDAHAQESDPVTRDRTEEKCYTTSQTDPGLAIAVYETAALKDHLTLLGLPIVVFEFTTSATDYWIAARLFDKAPDGTMTLVTRGVCRFSDAAPERKCGAFALFGNAWRFEKDHRLVLEVSQADTPFLRRNNEPSTLDFRSARLRLPRADEARLVDFRL